MSVQRRPAGYVSRTVVPSDLRAAVRRREIVRNLKTGSSREAKRRAAEFEGHVAALFRRLRHHGAMMEREQIDALVAHYLRTELDGVEETLAGGLSLSCETGRDVWQDGVIEKLQEIEIALAAGDHSATLSTAQAMLPNGSGTALAVLVAGRSGSRYWPDATRSSSPARTRRLRCCVWIRSAITSCRVTDPNLRAS